MRELSVTLHILSATLTPAIMLIICHALIASTSVQQSRVMDRIRMLEERLKECPTDKAARHEGADEILRARLLQMVIGILYGSFFLLVLLVLSIGIEAATQWSLAWMPACSGAVSLLLLLWACVLLIRESFVTVRAVNHELENFKSNISSPPPD